jgi:UDP-glucose 4-epimerase
MSCWSRYGQKELHGHSYHSMQVLITGGCGYIGGRLAQQLIKSGYQVILGSSKNYPKHPKWLPKAEIKKIDWTSISSLEEACNNIDLIVHTAGMNAQECFLNPEAALEFNGVVTERLVNVACIKGVSKIIYLSTAHVYCSPLAGVISEKTCPNNLHPYATSHLAGEYSILRAHQLGKIQGIVLRISNAFGPPAHKDANCWTLLVNDLCKQLVQKKELKLLTEGTQVRDFITLNNVTEATQHLIKLSSHANDNTIFNLGDMTFSILEMAELVAERGRNLFGIDIKITQPKLKTKEVIKPLVYKTDKLKDTGFQLKNNTNFEIDSLIDFCIENFGAN